MKIFDTVGEDSFKSMTGSIYKRAHGIILIFSVIEKKSFKNIPKWLK